MTDETKEEGVSTPSVSKESLNTRIKNLETERDQLKASVLAYEGAIQDCKYWLSELEKE